MLTRIFSPDQGGLLRAGQPESARDARTLGICILAFKRTGGAIIRCCNSLHEFGRGVVQCRYRSSKSSAAQLPGPGSSAGITRGAYRSRSAGAIGRNGD